MSTQQGMSATAFLSQPPANFVDGKWVGIPGSGLVTTNPANPSQIVYACAPALAHVDAAVASASLAQKKWSRLPRETRFAVLRRFASVAKERTSAFSNLLMDEIGKVAWEAAGEAGLLGSKVDITLDPAPEGGLARVTGFEMPLSPTRSGRCSFRPHGVMAVLGPFNFPAHLPNGHIIPALAAGNTVVFKPSDKAMAVGQLLTECFAAALEQELGAANIPGVINLVQGGADVASALVAHAGVDAIAFTGSWAVGRRILEANLDRPGRIVALELGGNNPTIVMDDADLHLAATEVLRSAFITTGQRCTCTRRVIVHEAIAARFITALSKGASNLIVGEPRATHPVFTGPINNAPALRSVLEFQDACERAGARVLLRSSAMSTPGNGHYVTPGIIQVDRFIDREPAAFDAGCDREIFGPLLRVSVVRSLEEAMQQANATRYGLAASIFTRSADAIETFLHECRAGCLNANTGTAGASSKLPFGGLGLSGNHRPAGSFALDYCAYPVASMVETGPAAALPQGMRFEASWLDGVKA